MNSIHLLLGTAVLMGSAMVAAAGSPEIVDASNQAVAPSLHDQKVINACANAFLKKIAPASSFSPPVADSGKPRALSVLRPHMEMEVNMDARSTDHDLIAQATCTVDYDAYVTRLQIHVTEPGILARMAAANIQLVTRR